MEIYLPYLIPLFFLTALTYSTVGFGGGSTYIALLILFSVPYELVPKIALLCNLVVVSGGCYFFFKAGHFSLRKTLPFILTSIPCAYFGGSTPLDKKLFTILLTASLLVAALRMMFSRQNFKRRSEPSLKLAWIVGLPVGAVLGGLAGLVGIGGGIFLLPVLYLLGWAHAKEAAASASFFILVNSLAGLMGQFSKQMNVAEFSWLLPLILVVFLGGQIGSRLGSEHIPKLTLQRVAGILILLVSGRLFWGMIN